MRWGHRPSGTEAIIALLLMMVAWVVALPVLGIAGLASEKEEDKVVGGICLVLFAIILLVAVCQK